LARLACQKLDIISNRHNITVSHSIAEPNTPTTAKSIPTSGAKVFQLAEPNKHFQQDLFAASRRRPSPPLFSAGCRRATSSPTPPFPRRLPFKGDTTNCDIDTRRRRLQIPNSIKSRRHAPHRPSKNTQKKYFSRALVVRCGALRARSLPVDALSLLQLPRTQLTHPRPPSGPIRPSNYSCHGA
jgi:hypothetical protein